MKNMDHKFKAEKLKQHNYACINSESNNLQNMQLP